jgi:carboxypeptidase Taq
MSKAQPIWDALRSYTRETALLESTSAVLEWDEHTGMPEQASEHRADQLMLLSGMIHRRHTSPEVGSWLNDLAGSELASDPHSPIGASIRCMLRDYQKQIRLPESLVKQLAKAISIGQQVWVKAKRDNRFADFLPNLEEIVRLRCEEAELLRDGDATAYDALLDQYEEGTRSASLMEVFRELREALIPLIQQAAGKPKKDRTSSIVGDFDVVRQRELSRWVAQQIGFDFSRGRLDETEHPFCTNLGPHDHRILTRFHPKHFASGLFGVLHEAGHGMYEQGFLPEWYGTPVAYAASLGVHESQSRLWENNVGLSHPFWEWCMPHARSAFTALKDVTVEQLVADLNEVQATLIRIEADEVTYNLHILIRFELEMDLVSGALLPRDLPEAWSQKYEDYLGIRPPNDTLGVLQDVHWSAGLIGYFPTYTLGNIYAAMLYEAAGDALGDLPAMVARGEFGRLLQWLREHVHVYGRRLEPMSLVEQATGKPISSQPLIEHLKRKIAITS